MPCPLAIADTFNQKRDNIPMLTAHDTNKTHGDNYEKETWRIVRFRRFIVNGDIHTGGILEPGG
jgi:hypothetical protein